MGSEVEGFYGLLRGVTLCSCPLPSQPPLSQSHLSPSSSATQQSPQESTGPEVSGPTGQAMVSTPVAATPAPEGDIPADMQPLRIQLGGAKQVYQCPVEGCKDGPSTSWAAICTHIRRVHLGVGLVCPLCSKSFFNPDVFRCHKKHINNKKSWIYKNSYLTFRDLKSKDCMNDKNLLVTVISVTSSTRSPIYVDCPILSSIFFLITSLRIRDASLLHPCYLCWTYLKSCRPSFLFKSNSLKNLT